MITLVHPGSPFLVDAGLMPPLGVMYLAAVLKKAGIQAQVIDAGLGESIPEGDIFITATTPQLVQALELQRDAYTAIGGPLATTTPGMTGFSLVVTGEAEDAIIHIVKQRPTGVLRANRISTLDELPFPDRTTAHKYKYHVSGKKAAAMITSRGCTGRCAFCCRAVLGGSVSLRSAQNVLAEAAEVKSLGFGAIQFYDDSIAISKKRLEDITDGLGKLGLIWRCMIRADQTDLELFKRMAATGCTELIIGVESGSQRILDIINKKETVEQQKQAVLNARKAGIKVKVSLVVGLPGEDWESINQSIKFIEETRPEYLDANILSVYRGSDIFAHPEKYDITFNRVASWFKGNVDPKSTVSTSKMNTYEIEQARKLLLDTHQKVKNDHTKPLLDSQG